jgi:hypothetical protein
MKRISLQVNKVIVPLEGGKTEAAKEPEHDVCLYGLKECGKNGRLPVLLDSMCFFNTYYPAICSNLSVYALICGMRSPGAVSLSQKRQV